MGIFGVPLTGADMHSGTGPDDSAARVELAIRTLQVGALAYPFFRNHAGSSDGYFLPSNVSGVPVPPLARAAITLRYDLLPHLYSLFVDVSRRGGTIVTPLAFEFPTAGVARVSTQFMLGGLMVCPVLAATLPDVPLKQASASGVPDATVECVFPQSNGAEAVRWFDWHTLAVQPRTKTATITAPIDTLPVFLRSGSVVTTQLVGSALTSAAARLRPYQLTFALAPDGSASGNLLLDDGESLESATSELAFNASRTSTAVIRIASTALSSDFKPAASATLDTVRVVLAGLSGGKPRSVAVSLHGKPLTDQVSYDAASGVLVIDGLQVPLLAALTLELRLGPPARDTRKTDDGAAARPTTSITAHLAAAPALQEAEMRAG